MTTHVAEDVFAPIQREQRTNSSRDTRSQHATRRKKQQSANVDRVLDDSFPASDPPSWTGAISRVAATKTHRHINEGLVRRVRAEYLEMPGLCLTIHQVQRLWGLEPRTCEALLKSLFDSRFLRRTDRGLFVLCTPVGSAGFRTNALLKEEYMPIGDIIVLVLVVLSVGWVAAAAIRSRRGAS